MENKITHISKLAITFTAIFFAQFNGNAQTKKAKASKHPNIIFIVADDLGYGNIGVFNKNSKIPTPNIDRLALEGTRYTNFYSGTTVCAPSRCALMTGKHMGHAYIRGNTRLPLRPQDSTLAQLFQQNGYRTGMFGKWGLGEEGTTGSPEIKGFDTFYGYLNQAHAHDYYTNYLYEVTEGKISKVAHDTNSYSHDDILRHALTFIRSNQKKPFFLYLPFTIPHAELDPPKEDMQPFLNADGSSKFPPEKPFFQNKGTYRSQQNPHAAFAAMITKLDKSVGQVVALIKELGLDEDTYIFFTSDNGPHKEGGADPVYFNSSGPFKGIKRDLYEGGIRVPLIVRAPGNVPSGKVSSDQWAFWDVLPTLTDIAHTKSLPGIDGFSFRTSLSGQIQKKQHDYLFWQFNEGYLQEAVIQKNWKLIHFKRKNQEDAFELYDLSADIGEQHNLAAGNPQKVKDLYALILISKSPAENAEFEWSNIQK